MNNQNKNKKDDPDVTVEYVSSEGKKKLLKCEVFLKIIKMKILKVCQNFLLSAVYMILICFDYS